MIDSSTILTLAGKTALFRTKEGLRFEVKVLKCRQLFGREDVLIDPVAGIGQHWVSSERIELMKED